MNTQTIEFVKAATDYCGWCESVKEGDAATLVREALTRLSRLYSAAFALPDEHRSDYPATPTISKEVTAAIYRSFGAMPFNYYRGLAHPSVGGASDELITGDLADDLTDIYIDTKGGLLALESGNEADAIRCWVWTHQLHWGTHAADALKAMQDYSARP